MNILRFLTATLVLAMAIIFGGGTFVVLVLADQHRGAMNELFAAGLGIGYLIPAGCATLLMIAFVTLLIARQSVSLGRLFGFSSVAVLGSLLLLAALLAHNFQFGILGVVAAVAGAISVLVAVRACEEAV